MICPSETVKAIQLEGKSHTLNGCLFRASSDLKDSLVGLLPLQGFVGVHANFTFHSQRTVHRVIHLGLWARQTPIRR